LGIGLHSSFNVLSIHCVTRGLATGYLYQCSALHGGSLQQHGLLVLPVTVLYCCIDRFMVNRKIFLVGFGLYGSIDTPAEYSVNIQVKKYYFLSLSNCLPLKWFLILSTSFCDVLLHDHVKYVGVCNFAPNLKSVWNEF